MNSAVFQAIYDGEALRDRKIDVEQLAPAMLALGELVREANAIINGDQSKVRLLVKANHEHQCFDIWFEVIQTFYRQIKALLGDNEVKTAKELIEWLGLLIPPAGIGLFAFLKIRKGRKVADVQKIIDEDKRGMVSVQIEGEQNRVAVNNYVLGLSENQKIQSAVSGVMVPLKSEGIDSLEFRSDDLDGFKIDDNAAYDIELSCSTDEAEEKYDSQETEAHLEIYGPIFDARAES